MARNLPLQQKALAATGGVGEGGGGGGNCGGGGGGGGGGGVGVFAHPEALWIGKRDCSLTASSQIQDQLGLRIHRPDGRYVLDLENYRDRAAAMELAVLAAEVMRLVTNTSTTCSWQCWLLR